MHVHVVPPLVLGLTRASHPRGTHTLWEVSVTKEPSHWTQPHPNVVVPQMSETGGGRVSLVQLEAHQRV